MISKFDVDNWDVLTPTRVTVLLDPSEITAFPAESAVAASAAAAAASSALAMAAAVGRGDDGALGDVTAYAMGGM